jgi:hypothetical protein
MTSPGWILFCPRMVKRAIAIAGYLTAPDSSSVMCSTLRPLRMTRDNTMLSHRNPFLHPSFDQSWYLALA